VKSRQNKNERFHKMNDADKSVVRDMVTAIAHGDDKAIRKLNTKYRDVLKRNPKD
jgi:hypothetical protein